MKVSVRYEDGHKLYFENIKEIDVLNGYYLLCKIFEDYTVFFYDINHGSIDRMYIYD